MDVDDEEVMLEEVLQDLKGSLKMYMSLRTCYSGPEKRGGYMGDWNTCQMISYH
jgi:hypothetical protein